MAAPAYAPAAPAAPPAYSAPAPIRIQPTQPVATPAAPPPPVIVAPAAPATPVAPVHPVVTDSPDTVDFPVYQGGTTYYPDSSRPRLTLAPEPAYYDDSYPYESARGRGSRSASTGTRDWPGLALGAKFGTTGIGGELTFGLNRFFNLRAGLGYATLGLDMKHGAVKYKTDFKMMSVPLLVDLYPVGGTFRLSAGAYILPTMKADLSTTPKKNVQVGSHTYAPDVVGTLSGKIDGNALAPYLGIGFGNPVSPDKWLSFSLDLGVIIQSYDVSLNSNGAGMTAKLDTFRQDLKKEESNIQKDADKLKLFPVLTLGLSFHF